MKYCYIFSLLLLPMILFGQETTLEKEIKNLEEYVKSHKSYEPVLAEYKEFNEVFQSLFASFEKEQWDLADSIINKYIKKKRYVFKAKETDITHYYIYKFLALMLYYKSNLFVEHDKMKAMEFIYTSYFILQEKCRPYEITEMFNYSKNWRATAKLYRIFIIVRLLQLGDDQGLMYTRPYQEIRFFTFLRAEDKKWKYTPPEIDYVQIELERYVFTKYEKLKYFLSIKDTLFLTYAEEDYDYSVKDKGEILKQSGIKIKNIIYKKDRQVATLSFKFDKKVFDRLYRRNIFDIIPKYDKKWDNEKSF